MVFEQKKELKNKLQTLLLSQASSNMQDRFVSHCMIKQSWKAENQICRSAQISRLQRIAGKGRRASVNRAPNLTAAELMSCGEMTHAK